MLEQVEIFCPHCFASFFVSPEGIPQDGVSTPCKKCGKSFTLVKASADPVKDRARRQQGFVVVHEKKRWKPEQDVRGASSGAMHRNESAASKWFESKAIRLGLCAAGIALILGLVAFSLWKSSAHSRFEKTLRNALALASNSRFEFKLEDMSFSTFGGITQTRGSLYGLTLRDRAQEKMLYSIDKIYFQINPSKEYFVTEPFTVRINVAHSKVVLKGCVFEATGSNGWQATLKAKDATADVGATDMITGQRLEFKVDFKGEDWNADPRFIRGHVVFGVKIKQVETMSENISRDVDLLFTLRNGLFPKQTEDASSGPANYGEALRMKWGESKTVAKIDRCSLKIAGSTVHLTGQMEFHNPLAASELDISFKAMDFSRVMKFIHRMNSETFDRIVALLVTLDEKKVTAYAPDTDSVDLNVSYKASKMKINEQDVWTPFISSVPAAPL